MELLKQHPRKKARPVNDADISYLREIKGEMQRICQSPAGKYPYAYAIAHSQVEDGDPLRCFVTHIGDLYMNPVILEQSEKTFYKEGCMSWPFRSLVKMRRYSKIKVKYDILKADKTEVEKDVEEELEGLEAFIFQHEIGHFDLNTVYPITKSQI